MMIGLWSPKLDSNEIRENQTVWLLKKVYLKIIFEIRNQICCHWEVFHPIQFLNICLVSRKTQNAVNMNYPESWPDRDRGICRWKRGLNVPEVWTSKLSVFQGNFQHVSMLQNQLIRQNTLHETPLLECTLMIDLQESIPDPLPNLGTKNVVSLRVFSMKSRVFRYCTNVIITISNFCVANYTKDHNDSNKYRGYCKP